MSYRRVNPIMWDDDLIIDADDFTTRVWFGLLTGPQVTNLPGLMLGDAMTIAAVVRRDAAKVTTVMVCLAKKGRIEVDDRYRLIRLPNAPKYNEPENPNVVQGWWNKWRELPESPLKYKHIDTLRQSIDAATERGKGGDFEKVWSKTFGTVSKPSPNPTGTLSEPSVNPQTGFSEPSTNSQRTPTEDSTNSFDSDPFPFPFPFPVTEEDAPAHAKKNEDVFDPTRFAVAADGTPSLSPQSQANLVALEGAWPVVTDPIYRREMAVGISHDHKGKDTASEIRRIGEKNSKKPQTAQVVMQNVRGYLDTCLRGVFSPQGEKPQERQKPKEWVPPEPRSLMNLSAEIEAEQSALNEKYRKLAEEAKAKEDAK